MIVPAYNEEAGIAATVTTLLDTDYPGTVEVIVVDDGSGDGTAAIVESMALPGLQLLRKPNGGKPSALNAGIAVARSEILVLVDGDTVFQRDTLGHLVAPFADPEVGAVSGNTKVANRGGLLGRWQHIEYVIGFNLDRRMFDLLRCMPTVPGAIGAFRRSVLAEVGGVPGDTLAEDTDLTMAICRTGRRVVYEEKALAWTEAAGVAAAAVAAAVPLVLRDDAGDVEAPEVRRGARRVGAVRPPLPALPDGVPGAAPPVRPGHRPVRGVRADLPGPAGARRLLDALRRRPGRRCAYALWLDGESVRPLWALPLQQFVYRQLMYLVVVQSVVTALLGARLGWHTIRRTGTFADFGTREQSPGPVGYK
ncbi:glycosyltransferase family 2 protein [Actinomadura luteofluorescens]|uniref:glycosyltransferase family 2 protein n=1 Tax=Actinomadura luteofluorescens TaxID=46163 RepID=UPI0036289722